MMTEAEKFIAWRNKRLEANKKIASPKNSDRLHRKKHFRQRTRRLFAFGDEMLSVQEIADRLGTSKAAVYNRIKAGIKIDIPVLSTATNEERRLAGLKGRRIGKRYLINGAMLSVAEIAARTGLSENTIYRRIRAGLALNLADTRRKQGQKPYAEFDAELFGVFDELNSKEYIDEIFSSTFDNGLF